MILKISSTFLHSSSRGTESACAESLRIFFKVKNECIMIDNFGTLSEVNSNQRVVNCDHDTLQGDGKKKPQLFYDGNSLTLCDESAKTLSVSTASSLTVQWKTRKPASTRPPRLVNHVYVPSYPSWLLASCEHSLDRLLNSFGG